MNTKEVGVEGGREWDGKASPPSQVHLHPRIKEAEKHAPPLTYFPSFPSFHLS